MEDLERKLDQLLKEPTNSNLFNEIGVLLYQVKDWGNAEMYFQRAYGLDKHNIDILYNYASLLYKQSQFQKAISIYKAYLEFNIEDNEVIQKMGDCYYQLGEYKLAAKMYEQAKECREENL